jgi:hypothetical protein
MHRLSRGQQNKREMSDSETPRQVEYGHENGLQKNLRTASRICIKLAKYCYTISASFETILQKY